MRTRAWVGAGATAAVTALLCLSRINTSASLPRGLYLEIPRGWRGRAPARGDLVLVCAPAAGADLARRAYGAWSLGRLRRVGDLHGSSHWASAREVAAAGLIVRGDRGDGGGSSDGGDGGDGGSGAGAAGGDAAAARIGAAGGVTGGGNRRNRAQGTPRTGRRARRERGRECESVGRGPACATSSPGVANPASSASSACMGVPA